MEEINSGSESLESGVSEGSSSEASSSESASGTPAQAAAPKQEQEFDWSKAFEHPRFKELVGQKNEALTRYQALEARHKALESQLSSFRDSQPKPPSEADKALEELKAVHPGLAATIQAALKGSETAKQLQERLDAFERQSQEATQQQQVQTAVARINQMHESNKVAPEVKQFINDKLDLLYSQGRLNLSNLDEAYRNSYEPIKKVFEDLKRSERESYVKEKTKDAGVPASIPKGTQAKPAAKQTPAIKSKDELRASVVKEFVKQSASERNATNV